MADFKPSYLKPFVEFMRTAAKIELNDGEFMQLQSLSKRLAVRKGWVLVHEGQRCTSVCFIVSGLFRATSQTFDGKAFVRDFASDGQISTDYLALQSGKPATCTIEALEDSDIIVLEAGKAIKLAEGTQHGLQLMRALLEAMTRRLADREMEFLSLNAHERLMSFLQSFPQLAARITKRDIASYLGITPVALSRIYKNI